MSDVEYRNAYMKGYLDAKKEQSEDCPMIMDRRDIVEFFNRQGGKKISEATAQGILRAVRLNYNDGLLASSTYITRAEFMAFLNTPERKKVRYVGANAHKQED